MNPNKAIALISLSQKAGKIASGEFSTEKAVKEGKAKLVIVADDASDNTKKKFSNMCTYYEVPYFLLGNKIQLGNAIGKEFRASIAIVDGNLAQAISKQIVE